MLLNPRIVYKVKLYNPSIVNTTEASELTNVLLQLANATIQIPGVEGNVKHGDNIILYGNQALRVGQAYSQYLDVVAPQFITFSGGILLAGTATTS